MMPQPPIVSLEIGTSKVCALVGEVRDDGFLMVTGLGECVSYGVRKGQIVDFDSALDCARKALKMAEEQSDTTIEQVHLVLSGAHIESKINRGTVHILNDDHEVTKDLMDQVMVATRNMPLAQGREVIHSIRQRYYIDGQHGIVNPLGMVGTQLMMDMLIIHGTSNLIQNIVRVARTIPADVEDVAFGGLCSALAVLTPEQKDAGALVLDIGGGTTDYLVYANQALALAGSIGVGGDHITNDISLGFRIPPLQAERLKLQAGGALVNPAVRNQVINLPADVGYPNRQIKLLDLQTIVNARVDELLNIVRSHLERQGLLQYLGAGAILTGGCAQLNGLVELCEKVFNMPAAVGRIRGVSGIANVTGSPVYASPVGLLKYAARQPREPIPGGKLGKFIKILGQKVRKS